MSEAQQKAYDLKVLGKRLKDKGLDLGEEAVALLVEELMDWAAESAVVSKNPYDDILAVAVPHLKAAALAQVDKIDGEDDEGR